MKYETVGPFPLARSGNLVDTSNEKRRSFWDAAEAGVSGISGACGCYIFSIRNRPWYVGLAEAQPFSRECFTDNKLKHYNKALNIVNGIPHLTFIARLTNRGKFSKPTRASYADVEFLERMLIGLAIERNPELLNVKDTLLLKEMHVPGLINTRQGEGRASSARHLRKILGI